jgi:hypothetical protein
LREAVSVAVMPANAYLDLFAVPQFFSALPGPLRGFEPTLLQLGIFPRCGGHLLHSSDWKFMLYTVRGALKVPRGFEHLH